MKTFADKWHKRLQSWRPSGHPINSMKELTPTTRTHPLTSSFLCPSADSFGGGILLLLSQHHNSADLVKQSTVFKTWNH